MYNYISNSIRGIIDEHYYLSADKKIFLDEKEIEFMRNSNDNDHRIVQNAHDVLAAIFRWQVFNGQITASIFPTNEEIKKFFETQYIDTSFLDNISEECHYLCLQWYNFATNETSTDRDLIRTLGKALYPKNEEEKSKRWEYSSLAANILKTKYSDIKWKL